MNDAIVESKIAEAANAAAVAKEADHDALVTSISQNLIPILQKALTYGGDDRPALVARIPVICNDIRDIKNNLWWIMTIGGFFGSGILIGIGLIALKYLGI